MSKNFIPVSEEHFQHINGILASLSKKTKKRQKKLRGFKWWLLNLERNARFHGNIDSYIADEIKKKYEELK